MITSDMLFNRDSVNIFTDASILKTPDGEYVGCPGCIVVTGRNQIEVKDCNIVRNTTNNNSEIKAIRLGVLHAMNYQRCKYIRLFSDSQICVFGLRDRLYNWARNANKENVNELVGYGGARIQNQDIFIEIMYLIVRYNIRVEFYHQRGHMNVSNPADLSTALTAFKRFNSINADIDINLIREISMYNNMVDNFTRSVLKSTDIYAVDSVEAYSFMYNKQLFDASKYKNLTHPAERYR